MRTWCAFLSLPWLALAGPALAQTFPADAAWIAFPCGGGAMVDPVRDQAAAVQERDVVGDARAPAGFRAVDAQFLYLRLRVEDAPTQGANLRPFAWGFAFSTNAVSSDYEVLVAVDGAAGAVTLRRNSITTLPDSPTDPADMPAVATYPFTTHGRTLVAAGSNFGGSRDHFIDMAVPWTALASVGLSTDQPISVWAGSSSSADRLDGDLACHDAMGSTTVPELSRAGSGNTTASSTTRPPGSGGSPGTGGVGLEGGPGCSHVPGARSAPASVALVLVTLVLALSARSGGRRPWSRRDRLRPERR